MASIRPFLIKRQLRANAHAAMELVLGVDQNGDGSRRRGSLLTSSTAPGPGPRRIPAWMMSISGSADLPRRRWSSAACWARPSTIVFETQLESLQNGDRFYYLSRTQGMNLLNQLEPNTFTDLVMRNTRSRGPALDASLRRCCSIRPILSSSSIRWLGRITPELVRRILPTLTPSTATACAISEPKSCAS